MSHPEKSERNTNIVKWWSSWKDHNRGFQAALRRCHSIEQVYFQESFHHKSEELGFKGALKERFAVVVALLSQVESHKPEKYFRQDAAIARQMGAKESRDSAPALSGLRFRRLLEVNDLDELLIQMIRNIRLMKRQVDVYALIEAVLNWKPETKKAWAEAYYSIAPEAV